MTNHQMKPGLFEIAAPATLGEGQGLTWKFEHDTRDWCTGTLVCDKPGYIGGRVEGQVVIIDRQLGYWHPV